MRLSVSQRINLHRAATRKATGTVPEMRQNILAKVEGK